MNLFISGIALGGFIGFYISAFLILETDNETVIQLEEEVERLKSIIANADEVLKG